MDGMRMGNSDAFRHLLDFKVWTSNYGLCSICWWCFFHSGWWIHRTSRAEKPASSEFLMSNSFHEALLGTLSSHRFVVIWSVSRSLKWNISTSFFLWQLFTFSYCSPICLDCINPSLCIFKIKENLSDRWQELSWKRKETIHQRKKRAPREKGKTGRFRWPVHFETK